MDNQVMKSVKFLVEHRMPGAAALIMKAHNIPFETAYAFIFGMSRK